MQYFGFDRPSFGIKTYGFGSSEFSPLDLFAGGKQGVWYDPSDKSSLFQDVVGIVPVTKDGDPVALMRDKSGNSNHAVIGVSTARPVYKTDGILHRLSFDGVDDVMEAGNISLNSNMDLFVLLRRKELKNFFIVSSGDGSSKYIAVAVGAIWPAVEGAGAASEIVVNGLLVSGGAKTTGGVLNLAIKQNEWVVVEVRNLDLSAWIDLKFTSRLSYLFKDEMGGVVLCESQNSEIRKKIRSTLAAKSGVTL